METALDQFENWVQTNEPAIAKLWDWRDREINFDRVDQFLSVASHGEVLMCKFFMAVWFGENRPNFDIFEARRTLDRKRFALVMNWLEKPFWP